MLCHFPTGKRKNTKLKDSALACLRSHVTIFHKVIKNNKINRFKIVKSLWHNNILAGMCPATYPRYDIYINVS